jgi:hypothetical protein
MADLTTYNQDFEGLNQADPDALRNDGWLVFANVFGPDWSYWYGYGPFTAPNGGPGFSGIDVGQGGPNQGAQQLVVYSDYNNGNHGDGSNAIIEANVFQEQTIGAADVGNTWRFKFDAKRGNIGGATTAAAFFKTLDPANGYALTNFITIDMTAVPSAWDSYSLSILIDPSLEGQILQFGFLSWASRYEDSGIFYDNIAFDLAPLAVSLDIKPGGCPNPLNTRARGVVPAAVLGSADFDVNNIDVSTLRLEGLAPIRSAYQDVAEPFAGELPGDLCGCTDAGPDGLLDLTLKFNNQDLIDVIEQTGDFKLTLTGALLDGTQIEGQDCVIMTGTGGGASFELEGSVGAGSSDFQLGSKSDTKPIAPASTRDADQIRRNRKLIKQRDR